MSRVTASFRSLAFVNSTHLSFCVPAHHTSGVLTHPCSCTLTRPLHADIDNWSAGYTIDDNVVINTRNTKQGWLFFQFFDGQAATGGAAAHDNVAHSNTICNSGPPPRPRDPWDEVQGPNVTGTVNLSDCSAIPPATRAIMKAAGPR